MKNIKKEKITILQDDLDEINKFLSWKKGSNERYHLNEGETVFFTAHFDDGRIMDIKCCGCKDECAYTEAVLFERATGDGYSEIACTDCLDKILGKWEIEYNNVIYSVDVTTEEAELESKQTLIAENSTYPQYTQSFILIKCMEREILVLGLYDDKNKAKEALAKDFIKSITQDYKLDYKQINVAKKLVFEKLKNLEDKSESVSNYDNYEAHYEIDLSAGTAWFNGHDYDYDWKIINLEEII